MVDKKEQKLSPLQTIKKYCKEQCCMDDKDSWKDCSITTCLLYKYRLGKTGNTKRGKKEKESNSTMNE